MTNQYTWEQTIEFIRTQPEFKELVELAYFEKELPLNVERYLKSEEFAAIKQKIKQYAPSAKSILDIGSGNGITSIAFALSGYNVITVEPDPSKTIGAGAIRILKEYYKLTNLDVYEAFAEEINFEAKTFDIVFARQCMHHAYDLNKFVAEMSRVLKSNGMFFTVRDHVVFDESDKAWFLKSHPLQRFYGGENAFHSKEYRQAITDAGLNLKEELKYYDSVINFFPETIEVIDKLKQKALHATKYGRIAALIPTIKARRIAIATEQLEKDIPGRMYSYIAIK